LAQIETEVRSKHTLPLLALLACFGLSNVLNAQYFRNSSYWKTHRKEITVGIGVTNFLGELGGRNQIGSPFVWDLEFSLTKPALSLGYRYYLAKAVSMRFNGTYGVLAGNDNLTQETFRHNRNLSFKSNIIEAQLCLEWHPFQEQPGHMYDLRGVKGMAPSRMGLYVFAGVGGFHFNPKTQFDGAWVELRPLGTEGQGLPDGADEYSLTQFCIPMGIGIRKALNKTMTIGLELQYTKTFTDYIDDVSGIYYDRQALEDAHGPMAAYLSDPSLGEVPGQTAAGQQRGYTNHNDGYIFLKAQLHYKLFKYRSKNKKYRTRIRRQKIVF
jgi:opacity protein-like surface antigen